MTNEEQDRSLRARYVRLVNLLERIIGDSDRLEEDEYYEDYDLAIDAARTLLMEERLLGLGAQ